MKRILGLMVVAVLGLSLVACNKGEDSKGSSGINSDSSLPGGKHSCGWCL